MRLAFLLLFCCGNLFFLDLQAQTFTGTLAYSGNNLWNPGVRIGLDYLLKSKSQESSSVETYWKGSNQLGLFHDPQALTGLYYHYGITYQRMGPKGFFQAVSLRPLGVFRSFLPQTFEVNDVGEVEQVGLPGRWYYSASLGAEIGHTLGEKRQHEWFVGVQGLLLAPYNTYVLPLLQIEAGYRFPILTNK